MKVILKNLGILKSAEFEIGDLTIICGKNNTGKTYAVYAFYGYLKLWKRFTEIAFLNEHFEWPINGNTARIDLNKYAMNLEKIIEKSSQEYTKYLPTVFASSEKNFENSDFKLAIEKVNLDFNNKFQTSIKGKDKDLLIFTKEENSSILEITNLLNKNDEIPQIVLTSLINNVIMDLLCSPIFPKPFIASAERTGAAIFRKELDFARNRLLEEMGKMKKKLKPMELFNRAYASYALPVTDNVDFTRDFGNIYKKESYLSKMHPEILADFHDIIGGNYKVSHDELFYIPYKNKIKLTMDESSSAVRSLLDIGFYLKHIAQSGDMLIVDEPELNLHPENQRRVARLFARLVNAGIKVFFTTHSDYIIKELNTLIMLYAKKDQSQKILEKYKYNINEMLSPEKVRAYYAGEHSIQLPDKQRKTKEFTFVACDISQELGIEVKGFDDSIREMDEMQEEILYGGEE